MTKARTNMKTVIWSEQKARQMIGPLRQGKLLDAVDQLNARLLKKEKNTQHNLAGLSSAETHVSAKTHTGASTHAKTHKTLHIPLTCIHSAHMKCALNQISTIYGSTLEPNSPPC